MTKRKPKVRSGPWISALGVILLIAAGLYFSGIGNGPTGKANCSPAEIAANVPCR
jgi:hypothetical protein